LTQGAIASVDSPPRCNGLARAHREASAKRNDFGPMEGRLTLLALVGRLEM